MAAESSRDTPPKQRDDDATAADRQLSDAQKGSTKGEPAPPKPSSDANLPDPKDVGEAG
ncbi:hypothetical protein [Burkholderia sp. Leaf177]|uniref:hypothetical protein n=1 Tax=Burkholderia sp. Leaf177 TaxID=1736287 RepID=UPI000A7D6BCC|nr:hypothetical protein [Burkholderia sp. Leaf177]